MFQQTQLYIYFSLCFSTLRGKVVRCWVGRVRICVGIGVNISDVTICWVDIYTVLFGSRNRVRAIQLQGDDKKRKNPKQRWWIVKVSRQSRATSVMAAGLAFWKRNCIICAEGTWNEAPTGHNVYDCTKQNPERARLFSCWPFRLLAFFFLLLPCVVRRYMANRSYYFAAPYSLIPRFIF